MHIDMTSNLTDSSITDDEVVDAIIRDKPVMTTYHYPLGQHKAAQMHATAIQELGGIAKTSFNQEDLTLALTADFEAHAMHVDRSRLLDEQCLDAKDVGSSYRKPASTRGHVFFLAALGGIASCSYNVAPKSKEEIGTWGTLFAAWGALTVSRAFKTHFIERPQKEKMVETAGHIITTNENLIIGWCYESMNNELK